MQAKQAKPGKPGTWNGKKQRFRTYVRAFRRMNPDAVAQLTERELVFKRRLVRIEIARRLIMAAVAAAALVAGVWLTAAHVAR